MTELTAANDEQLPESADNPDVPISALTFGDPEPVLSNSPYDYLGIFPSWDEKFYMPPVSMTGLRTTLHANGTHQSAVTFKRNQITTLFQDNPLISHRVFEGFWHDYNIFGNGYLLAMRNHLGGINRYVRLPALNTRVGTDGNFFLLSGNEEKEYKAADVLHLKSIDAGQSLYGIPEYFAGIQSVLLGESATLFRRKFYNNGAHAGHIIVTFDLDKGKAESVSNAIKGTKGPGNFRSLYLNMRSTVGGKAGITRDRVQVIPIGQIADKDEYERVKNVTLQDILNMHRVPAALASVMAPNAGGHGDLKSIREVYFDNEQVPMMRKIQQLNEFLPQRGQIQFAEPRWLLSIN